MALGVAVLILILLVVLVWYSATHDGITKYPHLRAPDDGSGRKATPDVEEETPDVEEEAPDADSAGVYFLTVEEFENRKPIDEDNDETIDESLADA